jgi:hypothetical protein
VTTKVVLWIVGLAALALAIYYAFGKSKVGADNAAGQLAATPPPAPPALVPQEIRPAATLTLSRGSPTGGILLNRKTGIYV